MSRKLFALSPFFGPFLALTVVAAALPLSEAQACACCGTYKVVGVDDEDPLNVRSGPGTAHGVVLRLGPDEGCIMKTGKRRGRWVEIKAQGVRGWVNGGYLAYIP